MVAPEAGSPLLSGVTIPSPLRQATSLFQDRFASRPAVAASAPGRINLIGEHLDYNGGPVLPFTIERRTAVVGALADEWHAVSSLDGELRSIAPHDGRTGQWTDFPAAVARVLSSSGLRIPGARLAIASSIPPGSGLSSSAALSLAVARCLGLLGGVRLDAGALADVAYRAEHDELGIPCGRMDQLIGAYGVRGHALHIELATLEIERVPLPVKLWVLETGVRHTLGSSEYPVRRRQCEQALSYLRGRNIPIVSLADLSPADLPGATAGLPAPLDRRVRHVATETRRTREAAAALKRRDFTRVGTLMFEGHESLRRDFESSCPEADLIVDRIKSAGGLGARLTGGGWGGAVVALLPEREVARIVDLVRGSFQSRFGREPVIWSTGAVAGVRREQVP